MDIQFIETGSPCQLCANGVYTDRVKIIETPIFQQYAADIWRDDEREEKHSQNSFPPDPNFEDFEMQGPPAPARIDRPEGPISDT